jgi:uncharacterized protein (TIGR00369 family)
LLFFYLIVPKGKFTAHEETFMQLAQYWNQAMPLNKLLGLEITQLNSQESFVSLVWDHKPNGNPEQKILYGGVTALELDLVGGVVAATNILTQLAELSPKIIAQSLSRLSTIDLWTDFLRLGRGEKVIATAKIIRRVSKVAVARMEMHNKKGDYIAFGTGTYMII